MALRIMIVRGLLSIIFMSGIAAASSGPLTVNENRMLQESCGRLQIPRPSKDWRGIVIDESKIVDQTWLLTIRPKGSVKFPNTPAFLISPRHVMTSAQVVLAGNRSWYWNGQDVENCCTALDRKHGTKNDLPIEAINTLEIWDPKKPLGVKIERGRLYHLCSRNEENYVPLILEISQVSPLRKYPCFITKDYTYYYHWGDWAHLYGLGSNGMEHRQLQIPNHEHAPMWFWVKGYKVTGVDRGGPLVKVIGDRYFVIGLKQSDYENGGTILGVIELHVPGMYFYNLGHLQSEICEFSGVCWKSGLTSSTSGDRQTITTTEVETLEPITTPAEGFDSQQGNGTLGPAIIASETIDPHQGNGTMEPMMTPPETIAPPKGDGTQAPIITSSEIQKVTSEIAQPITQRRETKRNTVPAPRPPRPPRPTVSNNNNNNGNGNGNGNGDTVNTGSNGQLDSISANADANHANEKLELLEIMLFLVFCFYWI